MSAIRCYEQDSGGHTPKILAGPKFRNAAQNPRTPSCVAELEGVAVGSASFFESRISFGGMIFPLCFPNVPVISHAGMASVEACLAAKHIKAAFRALANLWSSIHLTNR